MNELMLKFEKVSSDLSLTKIGVVLSIVQTIVFVVLTTMNVIRFDGMSVVNIALLIVGAMVIIISGALSTAIKAIFVGFNVSRKIFPYYFLDIICGLGIGFVVAIIIFQMPAFPCVYKIIKNSMAK